MCYAPRAAAPRPLQRRLPRLLLLLLPSCAPASLVRGDDQFASCCAAVRASLPTRPAGCCGVSCAAAAPPPGSKSSPHQGQPARPVLDSLHHLHIVVGQLVLLATGQAAPHCTAQTGQPWLVQWGEWHACASQEARQLGGVSDCCPRRAPYSPCPAPSQDPPRQYKASRSSLAWRALQEEKGTGRGVNDAGCRAMGTHDARPRSPSKDGSASSFPLMYA